MPNLTPLERFNNKFQKSETPNACWLWQGSKDKNGYGVFNLTHTKMVKAHRFAYELANGTIPDGMFVCHSCDNPSCINPAHLWLGTPADNMHDKINKGRMKIVSGDAHGTRTRPERIARGELTGAAKLTEQAVVFIRKRYAEGGITQDQLAIECGVTQSTVSAIVLRKNWKHIP